MKQCALRLIALAAYLLLHFAAAAELKESAAAATKTATEIPGWRVNEQPNLKQELENARTLKTEVLGEPALVFNVWE